MKKFLVLGLILLLPGSAMAVPKIEATLGGKDLTNNAYRVEVTRDSANDVGFLSFSQNTAVKYRYENYTSSAANALSASESGTHIFDAKGVKHTLPRAAPGLIFTISSTVAQSITVDTVDTSDTIVWNSDGTALDAGDSLKSYKRAGESITVFSAVANKWVVISERGSWKDNGTN